MPNSPFRLSLETFCVKQLQFSDQTRLVDSTLYLNLDEISDFLTHHPHHCGDVEIALVHPGDDIRIVHLLDAVEPRCKLEGNFPDFSRGSSGIRRPPARASRAVWKGWRF